jgi:hypothetical protein
VVLKLGSALHTVRCRGGWCLRAMPTALHLTVVRRGQLGQVVGVQRLVTASGKATSWLLANGRVLLILAQVCAVLVVETSWPTHGLHDAFACREEAKGDLPKMRTWSWYLCVNGLQVNPLYCGKFAAWDDVPMTS